MERFPSRTSRPSRWSDCFRGRGTRIISRIPTLLETQKFRDGTNSQLAGAAVPVKHRQKLYIVYPLDNLTKIPKIAICERRDIFHTIIFRGVLSSCQPGSILDAESWQQMWGCQAYIHAWGETGRWSLDVWQLISVSIQKCWIICNIHKHRVSNIRLNVPRYHAIGSSGFNSNIFAIWLKRLV